MKIGDLVETMNEARQILRTMSVFVDEHQGEDALGISDLYSLIDVKQSFKELISIIEESEINTKII